MPSLGLADVGPVTGRLLSSVLRGTIARRGLPPGRMASVLSARGVPALGVDVSPSAVAMGAFVRRLNGA